VFYDIHCHILPGIDDGARDIDESIQMSRLAAQDQIEIAVATPHHIPRSNLSGKDEINKMVSNINHEIEKNEIKFTVIAGQENKMSDDLPRTIEVEDSLLIGSSNYILVEAPFIEFPAYIYKTLGTLLDKGIRPILAHPERNLLIQQDLTILERLKDQGILLQVNTGSFVGHYGDKPQSTAENMLKKGIIDVVASDAHTSTGIRVPNMSKGFDIIEKISGANEALQLTSYNPHDIILGNALA
tara:strand:+ start:404 stop:1129 length:726 start_codon:yes stop_codon:yes gene_type:complete